MQSNPLDNNIQNSNDGKLLKATFSKPIFPKHNFNYNTNKNNNMSIPEQSISSTISSRSNNYYKYDRDLGRDLFCVAK